MDELHHEKYFPLTLWLTIAFAVTVMVLAVVGSLVVGVHIPWTGVFSLGFVVVMAVATFGRKRRPDAERTPRPEAPC